MSADFICMHPQDPHTLWYWVEDGDPIPVPRQARFDNLYDAIRQADSWIKEAPPTLIWMKIFRSDNEMYTCWRWDNPNAVQPTEPEPPAKVEQRSWWHRLFRL